MQSIAVRAPRDEVPASTWRLQIAGFNPERAPVTASILTTGNGYLGVRGSGPCGASFDAQGEGPGGRAAAVPAVFLAGLFDPPLAGGEPPLLPEESPALVPLPDPFTFALSFAGETLAADEGETLEYVRELDLRRGLLLCHWRQRLPSGRVLRLTIELGASDAARHVLLQRMAIVSEEAAGRFALHAALRGGPVPGAERLPALGSGIEARPGMLTAQTPSGKLTVVLAQICSLHGLDAGTVQRAQRYERGRLVDCLVWEAVSGRTYTFERAIAIFSSRETHESVSAAARQIGTLRRRGVPAMLAEHRVQRERRWRDADLRVGGDAEAERALRFSVHHLLSAANPQDEGVSIGARLLSGPGYRGHVFWDTEIYLLPFFTFTWPEAARALLHYRYRTLEAARMKAARLGYRGALYAWESAGSGHEATPRYRTGPHGERIPIFTGLRGHHISADVAYAVWQYWQASGDEPFFRDAGVEILLETARFWASRARLESDGRYHIRGVLGPDEFHQEVDDSAYTNAMARLNLELGRAADAWLGRMYPQRRSTLRRRLALDARELERWDDVAARLAVDLNPAGRPIEEFAGYFELEDLTPGELAPPGTALQDALGLARLAQTQVIKQADVVLLCHLLGEYLRPATVAASFDYYAPRCAHASSLSPSIYALIAARLGREGEARRLFQRAATLDLNRATRRGGAGVHAANCGGLWQATVFGVAGMRLLADGLAFAPHLLPGWDSLAFAVRWHGARLSVQIEREPAIA
ncbi:MAG TPA: glycosyl hydrolase family 65 protein, partial [Dehalococcoidia bacterium]